jgi:preprotein translocase subunit SecG
MQTILLWAQLIVSLLLVTAILLQQKGTGLGATFGGGGEVYHSRRGIEKNLFYATIVLAILFIGIAIFSLIIG